jgi:hypothetical protein
MDVSRNVTGAVSFLGANLLLSVYDFALGLKPHETTEHAEPAGHGDHGAEAAGETASHTARFPGWLRDSLPFLENVVVPLVLLLAAAAVVLSLRGDRRGYYGMLVVATVTVLWNAPDAVWHLQDGDVLHSVVCVVGVVMGVITALYTLRAMRGIPTRTSVDAEV